MRFLASVLLVFLLLRPAPLPAAEGEGLPVSLTIANGGTEALRCVLLFTHWVTRELGVIAPGDRFRLALFRDPADGALFIPRDDGERLMMVESLLCGRDADWADSRGQVPLLPLQASRAQAFVTACRAATPVTCSAPAEGS